LGLPLIDDTILRGRWPLVCNGVYLQADDLALSASEVTPIAGHVAGRFRAEQAMAYWRGEPPRQPYRRHPHRRCRDASEFVTCVVEAANRPSSWPGC
jgi:hypothetical protein